MVEIDERIGLDGLDEAFGDPWPVENIVPEARNGLFIACDAQTLFFDDWTDPVLDRARIYMATLDDSGQFREPMALPAPLDSGWNANPVISRDWPAVGSRIWWTSNRNGNYGIWEATWQPRNPCPPPPVTRTICREPGADTLAVTLTIGEPAAVDGCDPAARFSVRETTPPRWDVVFSEPSSVGVGRTRSWTLVAAAAGTTLSYTLAPGEDAGGIATWSGTSQRPNGRPLAIGGEHRLDTDDPRAGRCGEPIFQRADSNVDASVDVSDGVFTLGCLFLGEACSSCDDAADANDDGMVDLADAVATFSYLFTGGEEPGAPFSAASLDCGVDPTGDDIGCERYAPCE